MADRVSDRQEGSLVASLTLAAEAWTRGILTFSEALRSLGEVFNEFNAREAFVRDGGDVAEILAIEEWLGVTHP